tara:strand:- start:18301 stop:19395 length:1095 start_codon:yes stop_codon:yes gene_type:complete
MATHFYMYLPNEISNLEMLAGYLRTDIDSLNKLISGTKLIRGTTLEFIGEPKDFKNPDLSIVRYSIPKKNPKFGYRHVFEIENQFAIDTLKVLKFNLDDLYVPHPCVHGFVKGRNIATNARSHLTKKNLLNLDIAHFFETIETSWVERAFIKLGFNDEVSKALAGMTTISGYLVQGFHTSPVIANLVAHEMDEEIADHCKTFKSTFSRYADDISISSDQELPSFKSIEEIISKYQFTINSSKSKFFKRGQKQFVTGLSIFDDKHPRIPKRIKRLIRQELYYIQKFGLDSHLGKRKNKTLTGGGDAHPMNILKGWIDYIHSIEPIEAKKLYTEYNRADQLERERFDKKVEENGGVFIIDFPDRLK